jgi:hypothetical protein
LTTSSQRAALQNQLLDEMIGVKDQIPEDDKEDDLESMFQFVLRRMNEDADENEALPRTICTLQFPMMTGSLISLTDERMGMCSGYTSLVPLVN